MSRNVQVGEPQHVGKQRCMESKSSGMQESERKMKYGKRCTDDKRTKGGKGRKDENAGN